MELGGKAPPFELKDRTGKLWSLNELSGEHTVVYFYPKDNTPGCTTEALEFSAALAQFRSLRANVVGISGGDEQSKQKFCDKYDLSVLLLSDPDFSTARAYGAYGEKSFMGRKFLGILRKTLLLDSRLTLVQVFENVKPAGHPQEVIEAIKSLRAQNRGES